jgi:predicted MPP superfamily phosphohydrolase
LERGVNQYLAKNLHPWIPGVSWLYGLHLDRLLTVAEGEVRLPGLPAAFDGMTVLLITDIHAGPFLAPRSLLRTFDRFLSLKPDLVLLGGDLITVDEGDFIPHAPAFEALEAPLGVFAVLGNHDYYGGDPDRLRHLMTEVGIQVLHNRSVVLERGGDRLVLAGIDDLNAGQPDLKSALAGAPAGVPLVLLSHNPDVIFEAARRGVDLVLSGHTHGGQIRLPGFGALVRMSRYGLDGGIYATGGSQLVVSRGLGVTGLPLRTFCPPEAVFLRLLAEPAS